MDFHLGEESRLVINPDFELGIIRIAKGTCRALLSSWIILFLWIGERRGRSKLCRESCKEIEAGGDGYHKAEQFVNLNVIPGTSVNCERLFSLAKNMLTDTWKCAAPLLFEALLFLKVNSHLWDVYSVGKAMGRTRERGENEANDDSEYNRGGSNNEYRNHDLDEELLCVDDT